MDQQALYYKRLVKWGIGAMSFAIIANFVPPVYMWIRYGVFPGTSAVLQVWGLVAAAYGISWVAQPISYFPVVGIAGSYVGWLSGSVGDIRMTGASMGLKAADADPASHEGKVISNIATCTTVFVSASFVTLFTIIGSAIVPLLPEAVTSSFDYILPTLFTAIYADYCVKNFKGNFSAFIVIALMFAFSKKVYTLPSWVLTIGGVCIGVIVNRVWFVIDKKKKAI